MHHLGLVYLGLEIDSELLDLEFVSLYLGPESRIACLYVGLICLGISELFIFVWNSTQDLLIFYTGLALGRVCLYLQVKT